VFSGEALLPQPYLRLEVDVNQKSMEKQKEALLFLFLNVSSWMLYTLSPILIDHMPILKFDGGTVRVPLLLALNQVVGIVVTLSSYKWLQAVLNRRQSVAAMLWLLFFSYFVFTGHGIHAACVVVQRLVTSRDDLVYLLLDFLHVKVSHNMFTAGYFGLLTVVMCAEMTTGLKGANKEKERNKASFDVALPTVFFFKWLVPFITGIFLSVFAVRTSTVLVTTLFYFLVVLLAVAIFGRLSNLGMSGAYSFAEYHMSSFITFFKSSIIGVVVLIGMLCFY